MRATIGSYTLIPLGGTAYAPTGVHSSDVRTIGNALDAGGQPVVVLPNILPPVDELGTMVGRLF